VSAALYLGVDGGGTKTALVLIDADGTLRATHNAPGSYYVSIGMEALETVLANGVAAVLEKAAVGRDAVDFAFFGLPAYGEDSTLLATLNRLPQKFLRADAFLCGNDMVCGWAGSLLCRDGISIVAGTGSICYGERSGAVARSGGWGELFSDEGSAYWIACRGLNLFSRMSDGRRPRGPFYELVKQSLSLGGDLDLCAHVFSRLGGDRAHIAQLSKLVTQAAGAGDEDCRSIIGDAAAELALLVEATRLKLGFTAAEPVDVSYSGGVFEHVGVPLVQAFGSRLQQYSAGYRVVEPALPPAIGAALYAAKRHGQPLSSAAIERLRVQSAGRRIELES
jgi:N-acetylglucosamine kinase-like BadF-type ATPase